jgi:regulatory protein
MEVKNIGTEKAWQKIRHYCAYQERSHAETRDKLYKFGLYKQEVETLLTKLIEENYLNEERYAIAFAGGHFRSKQWGRVKIKYALAQKKVSSYCIKKALASIDEGEYEQCLQKLAAAKLATLKAEKNVFTKRTKLKNYLLQKGFELNLVGALTETPG